MRISPRMFHPWSFFPGYSVLKTNQPLYQSIPGPSISRDGLLPPNPPLKMGFSKKHAPEYLEETLHPGTIDIVIQYIQG
jgi:hypothetical protein